MQSTNITSIIPTTPTETSQERSTSPNPFKPTDSLPIRSTSTSSKLTTPSTPTKRNLSQNDEACFVEPPFPSPMPNSMNRRSLLSTDSNEDLPDPLELAQSTPIASTSSSSYPIQRRLNYQQSSAKPSESKIDFMRKLPIELGLYIILKINEVDSMVRCREVSKHWKMISEDGVVWHAMFKNQPTWKVKQETQIKQTISKKLRERAEEEEKEEEEAAAAERVISRRGSSDKAVARRFSQLIGIEDYSKSVASTSTIVSREEESVEEEREILDWFKVFRDRFVIESRWKSGHQVSRTLKGHQDSVYCLQVDDTKIVTGSRDRSVKVWDKQTGVCKHTLNGHQGSVLCLKFSGESLLFTGSSDCKVIQWDMKTGEKLNELIGHRSAVLDVALNDEFIVSCSKDTTIKLWSRTDLSLVRTIVGHAGPVNAIELSKTSQLLVSASGDSTMKIWNPSTGELIRTCQGHIRGLACIKLIEELGLVISGSNDESIRVWDLKTGQSLRTLLGHEGLVRTLDVDVEKRRLVSGSYDQTIKVWDFETGLLKLDFRKGRKNIVFDVSIDFNQIISVGHDSNITILDFADGIDCENFM